LPRNFCVNASIEPLDVERFLSVLGFEDRGKVDDPGLKIDEIKLKSSD
jgi:hypothetical protein